MFPSWDLYKITSFGITESTICSALESAALSGFFFDLLGPHLHQFWAQHQTKRVWRTQRCGMIVLLHSNRNSH